MKNDIAAAINELLRRRPNESDSEALLRLETQLSDLPAVESSFHKEIKGEINRLRRAISVTPQA